MKDISFNVIHIVQSKLARSANGVRRCDCF